MIKNKNKSLDPGRAPIAAAAATSSSTPFKLKLDQYQYQPRSSTSASTLRTDISSLSSSPIVPLAKHQWLKYILLTESNASNRPVVKHQVPRRIPGFTSNNTHTLADMLMPNLKSQRTSTSTEDDFHLVILYKDASNQYSPTPPVVLEELIMGFSISEETENFTNTDEEEQEDTVLFVYTLTRSYQNPQGDIIQRAISFVTTQKWFALLKDAMSEVLDSYLRRPTIDTLLRGLMKMTSNELSLPENEFIFPDSLGSSVLTFLEELSKSIQPSQSISNITIIIHTAKQSKELLTNMIMGLSELFNGFRLHELYDGFVEYYPVVDISNFETVINRGFSEPKFKIIGTMNSLIRQFDSSYDFYYDMDSGVMVRSSSLHTKHSMDSTTTSELSLFLSKIDKNISFNQLISCLKSFNIQQLVNLSKVNSDEEYSLKTLYLQTTITPVIFEQFFTYKSLEMIEFLSTYLPIITDYDETVQSVNYSELSPALNLILKEMKTKSDALLFVSVLTHFPANNVSYKPTVGTDQVSLFFKPLLWRCNTNKQLDRYKQLLILVFIKLTEEFEIDFESQMNEFSRSIIRMMMYGSDHRRLCKMVQDSSV
ncbi:hypothetical protein WICPIJ_004016 [Wickerhamomyces pijperi]|uniref:Arf3-interacting protein 1 N-terminal domain-containing protein n=1 Tax=Wickerhamomyces pijperi TaxID=599730 RepID=A0A9P8Q8R7_WICPI|nr:hypothetical protein WICPIJ_004016 [Wickerhamomyces pijperi]